MLAFDNTARDGKSKETQGGAFYLESITKLNRPIDQYDERFRKSQGRYRHLNFAYSNGTDIGIIV